jgi:hypothetical protein
MYEALSVVSVSLLPLLKFVRLSDYEGGDEGTPGPSEISRPTKRCRNRAQRKDDKGTVITS